MFVVEGEKIEDLVHGKTEHKKVKPHGEAKLRDTINVKVDQGLFAPHLGEQIQEKGDRRNKGQKPNKSRLEPTVLLPLGKKDEKGNGGKAYEEIAPEVKGKPP